MNKQLLINCLTVFAIALSGCKPTLVSQEKLSKFNYLLATADGNYQMTMPDFYNVVSASEILLNGGILDVVSADRLIDSLLVDTLVGLRAGKVNLREHYDYYFRFRENSLRALVDEFYKEAVFNRVVIDSQEVVDYFVSHQDEFKVEEKVQVYHIVTTTNGLKKGPDSLNYQVLTNGQLEEAARSFSNDLRAKIDSKETFIELAKKYSHDPFSARRGGLVEWAPKGFYAWPFDSLAFGAKVGEIVGPYRDRDGWQILYIDDYTPGGIGTLDSENYHICMSRVINEKSKEISFAIFDTLFDDINVEYNEALFDTNSYLVDKSVWAGIVNGVDTIDFGELSSVEELIRQKYKVSNSTPAMKEEMIQFLARTRVMAQTARSMGLDTLPNVIERISNAKHFYARQIVESMQNNPNWEPSDTELHEYYDANQSQYVVTKPLKVQQILVTDSSLAEFIRDQASSGVDFLKLAEEYYMGDKSVRRDLADLGYIGPEDVSPVFYNAARAVPAGEVSKPVKTEYGFHIIKVLESKWSVPFENARPEIVTVLKQQHVHEENEQFKNGLFKEFNVKKTGRVYPMHFKPFNERKNIS